jgi:sugar lactone lactonase YvrE
MPHGLAVGNDGTVYIADTYNHRVRKIDPAGIITTVAGNGEAEYSGDGVAVEVGLNYPCGVAISPAGELYIADTANQRIRKVDQAGMMTTVAGTGEHGYSGNGGPATKARLRGPYAVAVADDGSLYIADTSNELVRKVDPAGIITTVAGDGWQNEEDEGRFAGDGGPATEASLNSPVAVALGADGSLYIADKNNNRIRKVDGAGVITTIAGIGEGGYAGDDGPAIEARVNRPFGLAVGTDGGLYIADRQNDRIRKVDTDGAITTVAGGGIGDGGPATGAALSWPGGVVVDTDGSLYIADGGNARIRIVNPEGIITTVAGTGEHGCSGDGGPATEAKIAMSGGLVMARDGSVYFSGLGRVRRIDPAGIITTVAGTGEQGYSGDGGPATAAQLNWPDDLALGSDGSLYIAEYRNHRIRKVDPTGIITTVAGNGEQGRSGDGGAATEASLNSPDGIAIGPDGSLYIVDRWNHRVCRVDPEGIITTVVGTGEPGNTGDGGPATAARLNYPEAVVVGPDGTLYIADSSSPGIRKVNPAGIITTVAGKQGRGFWSDGGPASEAGLDWTCGLALGPDGSLYIAETSNDRIRRIRWLPCDPEAAKRSADDLRAKGDDSPEVWREIFELYMIAESYDDALAATEKLHGLMPEAERMRADVLVARVYMAQRDDHEARRRLIPILARGEGFMVLRDAADALVDLYLLRGERHQAIATLNDLRRRATDRRLVSWAKQQLTRIGEPPPAAER